MGLFPAPEIELQDLKIRGANNRFDHRNSCSSTSSSDHQRRKKSNRGLFGGCRCSVDAVETVPLRAVVKDKSDNGTEDEKAETKKKKGKQLVSRHRTFMWLKEISIAGVPDEA